MGRGSEARGCGEEHGRAGRVGGGGREEWPSMAGGDEGGMRLRREGSGCRVRDRVATAANPQSPVRCTHEAVLQARCKRGEFLCLLFWDRHAARWGAAAGAALDKLGVPEGGGKGGGSPCFPIRRRAAATSTGVAAATVRRSLVTKLSPPPPGTEERGHGGGRGVGPMVIPAPFRASPCCGEQPTAHYDTVRRTIPRLLCGDPRCAFVVLFSFRSSLSCPAP